MIKTGKWPSWTFGIQNCLVWRLALKAEQFQLLQLFRLVSPIYTAQSFKTMIKSFGQDAKPLLQTMQTMIGLPRNKKCSLLPIRNCSVSTSGWSRPERGTRHPPSLIHSGKRDRLSIPDSSDYKNMRFTWGHESKAPAKLVSIIAWLQRQLLMKTHRPAMARPSRSCAKSRTLTRLRKGIATPSILESFNFVSF